MRRAQYYPAVSGSAAALLWLACSLGRAGAVWGHGIPLDIAFWGNFEPGVAHCQRTISTAAARCSQRVIHARNACLKAQLVGQPCDTTPLEAYIQEVRDGVRTLIATACPQPEHVQRLLFIDVDEAVSAVLATCSELDVAVAAVFAPAMRPGRSAAVDDATRRCVAQTATAAAKLLRFTVGVRQHLLDQIAAGNYGPTYKHTLIARAAKRIALGRRRIQERLAGGCPDEQFRAVYHLHADRYLENIARRADCFTERVYIQSTITCPTSVCGNGVAEPGETCDDGNDDDADACPSNCMRRP